MMNTIVKIEIADAEQSQDEFTPHIGAELNETRKNMLALIPHTERHNKARDGKTKAKKEQTDDGYNTGSISPEEGSARYMANDMQESNDDSLASQATLDNSDLPGSMGICGPSHNRESLAKSAAPFVSRPVLAYESPSHRYMLRPSISLRQPDRFDHARYNTRDDNKDKAIHGALTVLANIVPNADMTDDPAKILEATKEYIRQNWCTCNR